MSWLRHAWRAVQGKPRGAQHLHLSPYVGTGTVRDPFRPLVPGHSIDFRPDCARTDGFAVVLADDRHAGAEYLGTDVDLYLPTKSCRKTLGSRLGVNLQTETPRGMITELLLEHGSFDSPRRWNPLLPARGRYEIWLGDLINVRPTIRGGSSITETFDTADSTTLGPVTTWTELGGVDWSIVSNQCRNAATGDEGIARMDPAFLTDHSTQATLATITVSGTVGAPGVACRIEDINNWYAVIDEFTGGPRLQTLKRVSGSYTVVHNGATTVANGDTIKLDVSGSTLTRYKNGGVDNTSTDSSLTAGTRGGLRVFTGSFGYDMVTAFDNVIVGDASSSASDYLLHYYFAGR